MLMTYHSGYFTSAKISIAAAIIEIIIVNVDSNRVDVKIEDIELQTQNSHDTNSQ